MGWDGVPGGARPGQGVVCGRAQGCRSLALKMGPSGLDGTGSSTWAPWMPLGAGSGP